ncbi:hypothetical protein PIB30_074322 [Stylosanthes scabra]|uniref:Uncharacterized protein n=1 Tax=Stylosanthes scabra TaxID=79078 RepID=A0ABU6US48_9FABA|nr:hypothetical protein [Stylosanthes scabra]
MVRLAKRTEEKGEGKPSVTAVAAKASQCGGRASRATGMLRGLTYDRKKSHLPPSASTRDPYEDAGINFEEEEEDVILRDWR